MSTGKMTLTIADIDIEIVRKNIKNIHLAVYPPKGRVRLASPVNVSDDSIRLFATSKLSWIRKQQRKFASQDRQSERQYIPRETHYYLGRKYMLRVNEVNAPAKVVIKTKSFIDLYVRPNSTQEQRENIITEWYRAELKSLLPELIQKWEKTIGVELTSWAVKSMKTKWGTCNTEKGTILLNLELIKKPLSCIEFIVVHELLHLVERKHNDVFLALMEKYLPKWRERKVELNRFPVGGKGWGY
jgi:predicted metal-dependent hydrolase